MPRGRLIFPFLVEIMRLDTVTTNNDPDSTGELTTGYDEFYREPKILNTVPTSQVGDSARKEKAAILIPAQIEPESFEKLSMKQNGDSPNSLFMLTLHYRDLERLSLVNPSTGKAYLNKGDRLSRILDMRGNLVEVINNPPGLFINELKSDSFGLGIRRNLLLVTFKERELAI